MAAIWSNMTIEFVNLARQEVRIAALRTAEDGDARTFTVQSFVRRDSETKAAAFDRAMDELKAMADKDPTIDMRPTTILEGWAADCTVIINAKEAE